MGPLREFAATVLPAAAILVPLFLLLYHFGWMTVKRGIYIGGVMGTPTKFWGNYRLLSGFASKSFRISDKYSTLSIRIEPVSGTADVEVLDQNGNVLHNWNVGGRFVREVGCRELKRCKVRISSRDFAGKFLVALL